MNDSEEFKPSLKQINEDIRPTWEDIKKQSEVLVNKLGCPRSCLLYTSPSPRD